MTHHSALIFILRWMLLSLALLAVQVHASSAMADKNWQFTVYLDGDEIGKHSFSVIDTEKDKEIISKASFDVKFLFITAYSYRHQDVERWSGNCLESINAITDDNGDEYQVSGQREADAFVLNVEFNEDENSTRYQSCLKTFAYWDPTFLNEEKLLNSQTGEVVDIKSEFIDNELVNFKGESVQARRYRILGEDLQIDLWYSDDDYWLALESVTESGRVVRYAIP